MKHKLFTSALAALAMASLFVSGCVKDVQLDTNQVSETEVRLVSIAPNPVARGGALRIMGSNLQKVTSVEIPGVEAITDIEVVASGKISEIRVIVPVDGPQVGPVTIVSGSKRISTLSDLEYVEPIIFDSFSPANAMPGDVITIKGDYMNNVAEVVFEGGAYVTEFVEQSRYELKVKVPSNAITGKVIIGDANETDGSGAVANLFYSENDLTIGDPTVKSVARGVIKAGSDVTVTGKYLDMIAGVKFGEVETTYTIAEDGQSLVAVVPDTAVDAEISLTSFAGKTFAAGAYETLVPSALKVEADTRFKAGLNATLTGKDLDLVTSAKLGGAEVVLSGSENTYTFEIPATSVDGALELTLANAKTVYSDPITLVKPTISSVSPAELFAGDEDVVVEGEDLDLVVSATLGGKAIELSDPTTTKLVLKTDATAVSGKVALTLANGVTVESTESVVVKYHSLVIVSEMTASQHIGEEVVLKGANFDLVENIFIGEEKVTKYSIRKADEVRFLMPWNKVGSYTISFHLFSGDVENLATPIEVGLERVFTTIWEGSEHIDWTGMQTLAWGGYDWSTVKPGTTLIAHFTLDSDQNWWQIRFGKGNWDSIPSGFAADPGGNIPLTEGATFYSIKLTAEDVAALVNEGGLVMTGANYTLTKIELVTEISQEVTIWEGEADPQGYAVNLELGGDDNSSWINAGLQVGQQIKIYFNLTDPVDWEIQIFDSHWGGMVCDKYNQSNSDGSLGYVVLNVTDSVHAAFTSSQGWGKSIILQGQGVVFTSITLL